MRKRVFEIVQPAKEGDAVSKAYDAFIMVVAVGSLVPMMFKTGELSAMGERVVALVDAVTVLILIMDYLMRWMTADLLRASRGRSAGFGAFIAYPFTIGAIVDLLGILPTIVPLFSALKFLRLLRLFRIFRNLKSLRIVGNVFAREGRTLISVLGVVVLFVFATGLLLFLSEPDTFSTFLDALYWATAALTTIGYGDFHPSSDVGQMVNAFSALFGILIIAIPSGIIAAGYVAETQRLRDSGEKSYRAIDVDHSLRDRVDEARARREGEKKQADAEGSVQPERGLRASLQNLTPKTRHYLRIMVPCTVFSCIVVLVQCALGVDGGFDHLGPGIAAFVLEPAAGIFVGFISTLLRVVIEGNPSFVLFFGDVVLTALVCGGLLDRRRRIGPARILLAFFVLTIGILVLQLVEWLLSGSELGMSETDALYLFMLGITSRFIAPQLGDASSVMMVAIVLYYLASRAIAAVITLAVILVPHFAFSRRRGAGTRRGAATEGEGDVPSAGEPASSPSVMSSSAPLPSATPPSIAPPSPSAAPEDAAGDPAAHAEAPIGGERR